jgi:hypothetical protein
MRRIDFWRGCNCDGNRRRRRGRRRRRRRRKRIWRTPSICPP